jgi:hypothetical protein
LKWAVTALAAAYAIACATVLASAASAQEAIFVSPTEGSAGSRFQIVGEVGWTPGETITLGFGFSDAPPGDAYTGPLYNEQTLTVLRDGTWSFPVVINDELFPFPLWRPGFIVIVAEGEQQRVTTSVVYTVEEERPVGAPPLAPLGFGPNVHDSTATTLLTVALFVFASGALVAGLGRMRSA